MKKGILVTGLILLFLLEIAGIYFIMPFPGSQKMDSLPFAYWLHNNKLWIRILLLTIVLISFIATFRTTRRAGRIILTIALLLYGVVFYYANLKFQADKIFHQPKTKSFANASENKVDLNKLVIGVVSNHEAKAYPIQLIGYHHQVRDTVGNTPIMVTYCTVCRTGRVFSPVVNGKPETFRLVGMDHFNAMFEDATTESWWQQATGIAVAGDLKGKALQEIPSTQSTLESWLVRYPDSKILQPDTIYNKQYKSLKDFDNGTTDDDLEKRDSASWKFKSWVIGIQYNGNSKAYDWNELVTEKLIQDSMPGLPLMITLENDTATFHVLNRNINGNVLQFKQQPDGKLADLQTASVWQEDGLCIQGSYNGQRLTNVQASQEFWHSWQSFHPNSMVYKK